MTDTQLAREKIRSYLAEKGISLTTVSVYFNIKKQDLVDYLNGNNQSKKAHETLTKIIEAYKIR
ncbi:hypothetical protein MMJ61_05625 [Enterococcus cecorum]|uniref:hypothetical protein n=1 Tax=Enterococcus cecorum TaxID=44008 RepID=UPI000761E672|nr:hypothetical protein [Enterococcus cecorum]MCJ0571681.1 hypothetical protein [Enterococcus cecorum]MCJ0589882.1 hypothetical protein [Enterococcus cecorum]MDZ5584481.1 hypothetical protein [Enterococcus cecorum]CAI3345056.1 antirepressor [Enterococcus cecorum]